MPDSRDRSNSLNDGMKSASVQGQETLAKAHESDARWKTPDLRPDSRSRALVQAAIEGNGRAHRVRNDAAAMKTEAVRLKERLAIQLKVARGEKDTGISKLAFLDPYFFLTSECSTLLASAVDAAIEMTGADMGNVQIRDPISGVLKIEAQRGFRQPFLEFFARVHDGQAACGLAMTRAQRVIVADVAASPIFVGTPALDVMLEARARAVQSTPLIGSRGQLLGVFSTHYRRPQRLSESDLRLLGLLARRMARWMETKSPIDRPEPLWASGK